MLNQDRLTQRYVAKQPDIDRPLINEIVLLSEKHPRYGYRRICAVLRREGWEVNKKRVYRLWRQEGLQVSTPKKKKPTVGDIKNACHISPSEGPHDVWSYDFLFDQTANGSTLKILVVMDEFTRCCLCIRVSRKLNHVDVVEELQKLFRTYGYPNRIRSDNGSEFIAKHLQDSFGQLGIKTAHIHPGSPWQNGYLESFNNKFRDELLHREIFTNLVEAEVLIEQFRKYYNEERPHSSLKYMTPSEYMNRYEKLFQTNT